MLAQRTDVRGVVTQPDRPGGRGQKLRPTPVKSAAVELGLPVYEPLSLREFVQAQGEESYDIFALASYGKILPAALLSLPRLGALNVHPSLLPKYRGATPIQNALLAGDSETGVTIMLMDAGMDTGDVVLQERTPIAPDERYGELHDRLAVFGAQALGHAIDLAHSGHVPHQPQSGLPSVTRPIRKEDLVIDWTWNARRIVNTVRAYAPAPAARAEIAGVSVKLLRARAGAATIAPVGPGEIVGVSGDALCIRVGDGIVEVLEVVAPSRRPQSGLQFARAVQAHSS